MKKLLLASVISAMFAVPTVMAEETCDVVIVGSGSAGLAAAVTANDLNKKVIIVEKMPMVGGNSNRAAGGLNAAESKVQAKLGIKDSIETMYNDTMKGGKNLNNPDLVRVLSSQARDAVDFVIGLGGDLNDVGFMAGATNKRSHRPTGGGAVGAEVVKTLYKAAQDRKIPIELKTTANSIIMQDGKAVGIEVTRADGSKDTIKAPAVVLAAGGFGANQEMLVELNPSLKGFGTTNHPGATGDGIKMGKAVGADIVDINQIQTHPTVEPKTGEMLTEAVRGNGAILVGQDGKRFCNEMDTRDKVSAAILALPGKYAYILWDQDVRDSLKIIETYVKEGIVTEGATPEELAKKLDMDASALKATLELYAKDQAAKSDSQFGRPNMERPLTKAPYYATKILPAVHHTMGGLKIDTGAHVIDTKGNQIPGLYAAGEVTGGVHGANRLGGNAQADIVVFGRIAGKNAAEGK